MKTGTDSYIQWKLEHYDQDVIKRYSRYICLTQARKIPRLTADPFPTEPPPPPPFLGSPYPSEFFHSLLSWGFW